MKKVLTLGAAAAALALSAGTSNAQLTFDSMTPESGNNISFNNNTFSLVGQFGLTTSSGVVDGDFNGSTPNTAITFNIGSINNLGGGLQTANVTGSGQISIAGLTGTYTWVNIYDVAGGGGLNEGGGTINVTGLSYSGGNTSLQALAANPNGVLTLSFNFVNGYSLTTLTSGGNYNTAYSGQIMSVAPVPEASTVMAGALMLLPLGIGALRSLRKERTA